MRFGKKISQRGYILITAAGFFAILLGLSTIDIVATSVRQLKDADSYLAIRNAESIAISTVSPIKNHIAEYLDETLKAELKNHLSKYDGKSLTFCGGTVDPKQKLETILPLCEPENLLTGLTGKSDQSIDFLSHMLPKTANPNEPDYDWQIREIQREAYNKYTFTIKSVYVGTQQLQLPNPPLVPRIDLYRYAVKASVDAEGYGPAYHHLEQYYDVVVSVTTLGDTNVTSCSGTTGFSGYGSSSRLEGFVTTETNAKTGLLEGTFFSFDNNPDSHAKCNQGCVDALRTCQKFGFCDDGVLGGKRPVGYDSAHSYIGNCVSSGVGSRPGFASKFHMYSVSVQPVHVGTTQF